jgi:hypothetical protein
MHDLVTFFKEKGYNSGVNLRAATYDFRSTGMKNILDYQYLMLK